MIAPSIVVRMLGPADSEVLANVAPDVFDNAVNADLARQFLADPRHHIAVAIHDGRVIGFASGIHYHHPDKPTELFVNEVSVAAAHRRQGIARRLLAALFERARECGCLLAWVGTEPGNAPARALYAAAGGVEDPQPFVMLSFDLR